MKLFSCPESIIYRHSCDTLATLLKPIFLKQDHRLNNQNQVIVEKTIREYGGTGRRAGFKIRSLLWCGFNSLYSYHLIKMINKLNKLEGIFPIIYCFFNKNNTLDIKLITEQIIL